MMIEASKISFSDADQQDVQLRYKKRFEKFGYSPKTLGWNKKRQSFRFNILSSEYDFEGKKILDIGCGFGDLNKILPRKANAYFYTGLDLSGDLIEKARELYPDQHIQFIQKNILDFKPQERFDYAIASGVFNHKLSAETNYEFIEEVIAKSLSIVDDGLAFDFLSDKVDYRLDHTFHSSPEKILSIAYKYSRNVILKNNYMPFEFSLFINKNDHFEKDDAVFSSYKNLSTIN